VARKPKFASTITFDGPFFEKDPTKTFRQNIRELMDEIAAAGESDVKAQLQQGQGDRYPLGMGLGRVSMHVVGRTKNLSGKRWAVTAIVSPRTAGMSPKQAVKVMAAASYLEDTTGAFKRSARRVRKASKLNDLTEGM